ncbi:MAG: hypothetical protein J5996_01195 [Prevotella sp.]|nr:hypothetical protein [Prevotella sp.]
MSKNTPFPCRTTHRHAQDAPRLARHFPSKELLEKQLFAPHPRIARRSDTANLAVV